MHIPEHILSSNVSHPTSVAGALVVGVGIVLAIKSKDKPNFLKFAAISSLIFALQMMNFPILNGTSGHFLGTTLAVTLLGTPFGILSIVAVLTLQSLIFADGGIMALGANIVNMCLVGAIPGFLLNLLFKKRGYKSKLVNYAILFLASFVSIVIASIACSVELGLSGTNSFGKVLSAMVGVHSIVGIFEGAITVVFYIILQKFEAKDNNLFTFLLPFFMAIFVALVLSPFASSFPDGLEWVMDKYIVFKENAPIFVSPLTDYTVPFIKNEFFTTSLAGVLGVLSTFLVVLTIGKLISLKKKN